MRLKSRHTKSFNLPKWALVDDESKKVIISTRLSKMDARDSIKRLKQILGNGYEYEVKEKF